MRTDFDTIELKSITLEDCKGKPHEFHFFTQLGPSGLAINVREMIRRGQVGYSFSTHGPHGCSQEDLILDLYEKMKRGLLKKYLEKYNGQDVIKDRQAVGRIEWDDDYSGEIPRLVIDGRVVTWSEFGKMLMSFEGWQFKLDMIDSSEEV